MTVRRALRVFVRDSRVLLLRPPLFFLVKGIAIRGGSGGAGVVINGSAS